MRKLCQLDTRWSQDTLGHTEYTIGRWGCTVTAICMLQSRMDKETALMPPEAAKKWNFTDEGKVYWSNDFGSLEFKGRYRNEEPDKTTLKEWMTKERGIILEVNYTHWVVGYYNGWWGLYCVDPIDGKVKQVNKHYKITGFALFAKK